MQRSDQINDLAAALVQARPKFKPVKKTHTANVQSTKGSYKYTYSTLDDLNESTVEALAGHGLVTLQNVETARDAVSVSTMLLHATGQFIHFDPVTLAGGGTPQSIGSAITYARRYSLQAALGIAAEEDDDGQRAQSPKPARAVSSPAAPPAHDRLSPSPAPMAAAGTATTNGEDRVVSDAQRKRFFAISKGKGWSEADVKKLLAKYGYASSKDIKVRDYDALVKVMETGEVVEDDPPNGDREDNGGVFDYPAPWEHGEAH